MKIALYIEDGLEQIVLTPETKTEKGIVEKLLDGSRNVSIKRGAFYACQGGWTRQRDLANINMYPHANTDDESVMIVLRPAAPLNGDEKQ